MNTRQELISDIKKFTSEADENKTHGEKWIVKKSDYLTLINRIVELTTNDFENQNKYNIFSEYMTKVETTQKINGIKNSFQENHLDMLPMLVMGDLFIVIESKLK